MMAPIASRPTTPPSAPASFGSGPTVSTALTSVEGEDDETPVLRFTNVHDLMQKISSADGDFLKVTRTLLLPFFVNLRCILIV